MRRKKQRGLLFIVLFTAVLGMGISSGDELIEPTRKLDGNEKEWGSLTLFSEPPQLDVHMDGKKVGKTPVWLQPVEAVTHIVQIGEITTAIQVKKGKTVKYGLFKGELVKIAEADQRSAPRKPSKQRESRRSSPQQPSTKQKKEDLTRWDLYINGSLQHF